MGEEMGMNSWRMLRASALVLIAAAMMLGA
jgi:hypothetical protein